MRMTGIKRPQQPGTGRNLSNVAKRAMRDRAVEQIKVLLAEKPMAASVIAERLGLKNPTAYAYLHHMACTLRLVRRNGQRDENGRELWILGADHTLPSMEDQLEGFSRRIKAVPAQQIGIPRDSLVAALFGPARGEVAC